jgi:ANTAR domain
VASQPTVSLSVDPRADGAAVDGQDPGSDGRAPAPGELVALQAELDGLRQRMRTLPVIEQSKGMLMAYYGVDADTAFAILRRWSTDTNTKLREISEQIVAAASKARSGRPSHPALRDVIARFDRHSADHVPHSSRPA